VSEANAEKTFSLGPFVMVEVFRCQGTRGKTSPSITMTMPTEFVGKVVSSNKAPMVSQVLEPMSRDHTYGMACTSTDTIASVLERFIEFRNTGTAYPLNPGDVVIFRRPGGKFHTILIGEPTPPVSSWTVLEEGSGG